MLRDARGLPVSAKGSEKRNVIPPEAVTEIDCRMLAGEDPEEARVRVREVVDDEQVEVAITAPAEQPYGHSPFVLDGEELRRIQRNDERVSLDNARAGVRAYAEMLLAAAGA